MHKVSSNCKTEECLSCKLSFYLMICIRFFLFSSSDLFLFFFLYSNDLRVLTGGRSRNVNVGQSVYHFVSDYYASTTYFHEILHSN